MGRGVDRMVMKGRRENSGNKGIKIYNMKGWGWRVNNGWERGEGIVK
jgi:hypothetical protein